MEMRLSEAISLGHTLIGESTQTFLCDGCGCAIGSAIAALGDEKRYYAMPLFDGSDYLSPIRWLHERYPWTMRQASDFPLLASKSGEFYRTVANQISWLHATGMPRLEIAALIAQIEPPEEPAATPDPVEVLACA